MNQIQIKDLGMFLGCECLRLNIPSTSNRFRFTLTPETLYYECGGNEDSIRLLLRKFSDMTQEEAIEFYNTFLRDKDVSNTFKYSTAQELAQYLDILTGTEAVVLAAKWLISKQFDVLNLIEKGLAFDKNNIPEL